MRLRAKTLLPVLLLLLAGAAWGTVFLVYEKPLPPIDPARYAGTRLMAERLAELNAGFNYDVLFQRYPALSGLSKYYRGINGGTDLRSRILVDVKEAERLMVYGSTREALELYLRAQTNAAANRSLFDKDFFYALSEALGLAYLRLGEQENCVTHHGIESCLLPIQGSGIHSAKEGSRAAAREYTALLEVRPDDLVSRWLLNIAHMTLGEYPEGVPERWRIPPAAFRSEYDIGRFSDVSGSLGLDVQNRSGGSIMEDFDGDGYLDIVASSLWLGDQIRYFHNNADGTFTDRTKAAGLTGITGGLNISHTDYDNDGRPDILVLRGAWMAAFGRHPKSLLRNKGDGTFEDVTVAAGLLSFYPSQTGIWGDFDNDGWIDLFVGNESITVTGLWNILRAGVEDVPEYFPRFGYHPCELFRNNRNGTFTNIAREAGVDLVGFVKGAGWGDYDNDGKLDLYVSYADRPNRLFHNLGPDRSGKWRFQSRAQADVAGSGFSFATWFWDYNNDGWQDLFVADLTTYQFSSPRKAAAAVLEDYLGLPVKREIKSLYRNNRDGTFTDVTREAGLNKVFYAMGSNYGDFDNDGYPDFYLGTGNPDYRTIVSNRMFRNEAGKVFQDITTSAGVGHLQKGHGVAIGDIDNDGDQDIYIVMGGAFPGDISRNALFMNPGQGNHWVTLRLEGVSSNRAAIGARIKVTVDAGGANRDIYATVSTGGSFGSSSLQQEIGLGAATAVRSIEVLWPASGKAQVFKNVEVDRVFRIREGDSTLYPVELKRLDFSKAARNDVARSASAHVH